MTTSHCGSSGFLCSLKQGALWRPNPIKTIAIQIQVTLFLSVASTGTEMLRGSLPWEWPALETIQED